LNFKLPVPTVRLSGSKKQKQKGPALPVNPDVFRKEMMAAGERLKLALRMEDELYRTLVENDEPDLLSEWRECRRSVERFAEDYASALSRYRRAVERATLLEQPSAAENGNSRKPPKSDAP